MTKRVHRFRQSQIKTASLCLERARREWLPDYEQTDTDAACVGTAVHEAIETCLSDPLTENDSVEVFHDVFSDLIALPTFRYVKYTEQSARHFGEKCVRTWHRDVLPDLPQDGDCERHFVVPFHEDDQRIIELSGTIDYIADGQCFDWKTASREWRAWEHARWDPQPTAYTYAAVQNGWIEAAESYSFRFVVLGPKGVQDIPVTRTSGDWDWLRQRCVELAEQIEADLPRWPTNDAHALCSPVWCDFWSECKGKHVAASWPK